MTYKRRVKRATVAASAVAVAVAVAVVVAVTLSSSTPANAYRGNNLILSNAQAAAPPAPPNTKGCTQAFHGGVWGAPTAPPGVDVRNCPDMRQATGVGGPDGKPLMTPDGRVRQFLFQLPPPPHSAAAAAHDAAVVAAQSDPGLASSDPATKATAQANLMITRAGWIEVAPLPLGVLSAK